MINFCNPITDVNDSVSRHNIERGENACGIWLCVTVVEKWVVDVNTPVHLFCFDAYL